MIRVLQCVNNMHRAGLETMIMNYYRNIDRTQVQFDFLMHRSERSDYDDEIEKLGGRIFRAPRLYPQNYPAYFRYMKHFFAEHPEYQTVHSHIDAMSFLPLLAAKRAGVPVRIAHSHNTSIEDGGAKRVLKQVFRYMLPNVANYHLACGKKAGQFLFRSDDFTVIPNAVDAGKFNFSPEVRARKRKELGLQDETVIGHVGRFTYAKNHPFLIDIFCEVLKKNPDAKLMLVGTGSDEAGIRRLTEDKNIADHVMFMGSRGDVNELYQVMDVFVMPSHFEGIPLVGVEAQFASLPCIFSDTVPEEVCFTPRCAFVKLSESACDWAAWVLKAAGEGGREARIENDGYNVLSVSQKLVTYYHDVVSRK